MTSFRIPPILCSTDLYLNAALLAGRTVRLLLHAADAFKAQSESQPPLARLLRPLRRRLRAETERLRRTGAEGETELPHGSGAESAIAGLADVIVVGRYPWHSGHSASSKGSVTHAVMQQTFRPVYLVRPPAG